MHWLASEKLSASVVHATPMYGAPLGRVGQSPVGAASSEHDPWADWLQNRSVELGALKQ
jgi:hypothetical protein